MIYAHEQERRQPSCFDCGRLELRQLPDGRYVYWCSRRDRHRPDPLIWRPACRHFRPRSR
jgi:hypothetical protein